jgi:outer membrane protein TolC
VCPDAQPAQVCLGLPRAAAPALESEKNGVQLLSAQFEGAEISNSTMPFEFAQELHVNAVVETVLARNPTLPEMFAAYQAAMARYPQATSLDDPMFGGSVGPATIGADELNFAYRLEIAQKFPWGNKLALRGESALAQASAAGHAIEDARLQLRESARMAFYDYYLATRALEVNEEALRLLREFRASALERYRNQLTPQQDILQADVEI